ncbi:hypothetical protein OF83DRAFT_1158937 [Amylostereum chailletii]|nr:hypothetical protein OF83DRAFT_1158937 [Amylostereum chailletii]
MDLWDERKKKEMMAVRRSVSEVGYVGMLKRKMGWKIRPPEDVLEGEAMAKVEALEKVIVLENRKRDAARARWEEAQQPQTLASVE